MVVHHMGVWFSPVKRRHAIAGKKTKDIVQSHERIAPGCDIFRAGDGVHRRWLLQRQKIRLLKDVGYFMIDTTVM